MNLKPAIVSRLYAGKTVSTLWAMKRYPASSKLTSRISELRGKGHPIEHRKVKDVRTGKRYYLYFITPENRGKRA